MISVSAEITGDVDSARRMILFRLAMAKRLRAAVKEVAKLYADSMKGHELSGGVLKSDTGHLKRSVVKRVRLKGEEIRGLVYPTARYGWKVGQGTPKNEVTVREHLRTRSGAGEATASWTVTKGKRGGSRYAKNRGYITHSFSDTRTGAVVVKSHIRKMLLAKIAKPFMGPAYMRMRSIIERRLRAAAYMARQDMESQIAANVNPMDVYMSED